MKRTIISTISVVVLSTVLSGCMDKLEILPNDQIITENFFEEGSPEEIESGVNSMYQRLQSSYMYNLRMWTLDIVVGEDHIIVLKHISLNRKSVARSFFENGHIAYAAHCHVKRTRNRSRGKRQNIDVF